MTIALVFGVRLSFGIFFEALTRAGPNGAEFDWTRADTAGAFSVTMIVFASTSTLFGWMLDRWGARRVYVLGIFFVSSGLVMTSRMTSLLEFYLYFGVWTAIGITILGLSIQAATLSRWFARTGRRGLAIGLAFSGTGIGIVVLAPIVERVITAYGWRNAYLLLAALVLCSTLPFVLLFLRDDPAHMGLTPDGMASPKVAHGDRVATRPTNPESHIPNPISDLSWSFSMAARTPIFWLIMLSGACSLFSLRMVSVHQVAHFVDKGIPRLTAATVLGGAGMVTAITFIAFGALSDRIGRPNVFYMGAVAQVAALLLLMSLWPSAPLRFLYMYALLWGIGEGSRSSLLTAIASDTFPGPSQGIIVGTLGGFFGVGAASGSWVAGRIFDLSGSYVLAFQIALVSTLVATVSIWLVARRASS